MAHLREKTSARGTVPQTEARLDSYFASLRGPDGIARLRLLIPANGTSRGRFHDREVRIEAWRDRDDQNLNDLIRIRWTPEGSVIYPNFAGTLVVRGEGDPDLSFVELDGDYKHPLGATGELFDETIGHRIAQLTARELLKDLKRAIDGDAITRSIPRY